MSLRDWFAGMALSSFAVKVGFGYENAEAHQCNYESEAINAYKYADAMLKEREKNIEKEAG